VDPEDDHGGIEFSPAPLTAERRRVDRVAVVGLAVALGLILAVAKPWAAPPSPDVRAPASAAASITAGPTSRPAMPGEAPSPPASPTPASILAAIQPHDAWGVRAITRSASVAGGPDRSEVRERWTPALERDDGTRLAVLPTSEEVVLALGVTSPGFVRPRDVVLWRVGADGIWQETGAELIAQGEPGGAVLLEPATGPALRGDTWPAGAYRIELRLGSGVRVIDLRLPGRFERIPEPPPAG
jgi:hypothetical protein